LRFPREHFIWTIVKAGKYEQLAMIANFAMTLLLLSTSHPGNLSPFGCPDFPRTGFP
jgi:hypothetical protein